MPLLGLIALLQLRMYIKAESWFWKLLLNSIATRLGNEVNLYHDFTSQDYVNAAHQLQAAIVKALDLTDDGQKIFEVLDLSSPVPDPGAPLSL